MTGGPPGPYFNDSQPSGGGIHGGISPNDDREAADAALAELSS